MEEFIRRNADPIWLHQNELWELMDTPDTEEDSQPPPPDEGWPEEMEGHTP